MLLKVKLRTWLAGSVVCVVVAMFGFVVWRATTIQTSLPNFTALPVIKAPSGPARVPPDAPGGLQVLHQDMTVFDTFEDGQNITRVEKVLPRVDTLFEVSMVTAVKEGSRKMLETEVVNRTDLDEGVTVAAKSMQKDDNILRETVDPNITAPSLVVGQRDFEGVRPIPTNSLYGVQLASLRSFEAAEAAWEKLSVRVPYLLADLSPTIIKVDLAEGGGIFYRLHAGTLPNRETAAALCRSLAAEALDCLIVQP